MQELFNYKNVFFDSKSEYSVEQINEREYCKSLFTNLERLLSGYFRSIQFFVLFCHDPKVIPESSLINHKRKVLIWFSEETGNFPNHLSEYYALIFKSYIKTESLNIYANPLGYVNEFEKYSTQNIRKDKNLFFSGNLNSHRKEIYELFAFRKYKILRISGMVTSAISKFLFFKLKIRDLSITNENSFIFFSNGFKSGLVYPEYVSLLSTSKFVLCPKGFQSNETFRHIEALHFGCIVISDKMPDVSIYDRHPFIIYNNVKELNNILNKIIKHQYDEQALLEKHISFYKKKLSAEAASLHISGKCLEWLT